MSFVVGNLFSFPTILLLFGAIFCWVLGSWIMWSSLELRKLYKLQQRMLAEDEKKK